MNRTVPKAIAAQVLGKGMAVLPDEGKVFAPCEAQVTTVFDTKHAIGLTTKDGVELLIHIGINTVELGGKYYEIHVAEGDQVQPGQLMATFDITEIQSITSLSFTIRRRRVAQCVAEIILSLPMISTILRAVS